MKEKIGAEVYNSAEHKKLAYTEDFKEWIKANPGIIKKFNQLMDRLDAIPLLTISSRNVQNKEVITEGPIRATLIHAYDGHNLEFPGRYYYFKLDIGEDSFFVKSEGLAWRGQGYDEFKNTSTVKEKIKDLPWVDTVEFQLGYQDNKARSFFVSKWRYLPILQRYIMNLEKEGKVHEVIELKSKIRQLKELLPDFQDVEDYNMLYDPTTSKIVLFDLFTGYQGLPPSK